MYRLRWNLDYDLDKLYSLLDGIDNQTLIEVFIDKFTVARYWTNYINRKNVNFESLRNYKTTKKAHTFNYKNEHVAQVWQKLFAKNIFDLRIMTLIDDADLQQLILDFLKPYVVGDTLVPSRVRDVDLKLQTPEDTHAVLEALADNYMIKTVRLSDSSNCKVSQETEKLAEDFKNSRVGTEIRIITLNKKLKKSKM